MVRWTQVKFVLTALYKYLIWRKCEKVSPRVRADRILVCNTCPHLVRNIKVFHPFDHKCLVCGCYLKLKTWCIDETCPENKWRV